MKHLHVPPSALLLNAAHAKTVHELRETLRLIHESLPQWRTDIDVILEQRAPWLPKREVKGLARSEKKTGRE